jgi:XTP/dITP diphosphohydrolase
MRRLVVATRNPGKLHEVKTILADVGIEIVGLEVLPDLPEIEETGSTFLENASLKAVTVSRATGELAMGEDSGLEIDALDGAPGIYSARFSGKGDLPNNRKVLDLLKDVPPEKRGCRYRCVVVLALGSEKVAEAQGTLEGRIALEPAGSGGFGYDPIFLVPEAGRTTGQMSLEEKNRISHRGRALREMRPHLIRWMAEGRG